MPLISGDPAPDFELPWRPGADPVRLSSELEDGPVVLLFFPLAFSSTCTEEMCAVAESWDAWEGAGARVLGISVDSPFVNVRFAEETGAPFPILSDFNRDASALYDVLYDDYHGLRGVSKRAAFVIAPDQTIAWSWVTDDSSQIPDLDAVREAAREVTESVA